MASIDITDLRMKLGMSATLAEITCGLVENKLLTRADIQDTGASNPRVTMNRIRNKLHAVGVDLSSQRHLGYWLDDENKDRLIKACTPNADGINANDDGDVDGDR